MHAAREACAKERETMNNLDDEALNEVARYFGALAVPMRLKIVNALRGGERNVGELTAITQCTQANVSKHLAVLAQSGMVAKTARGTSAYYRCADPRIYQLCELVCGQLGRRYEQQSGRHRLFTAVAPASRKRASIRSR
jgi:DNA-binding transcriptional ArsR family regulator